MDKVWAFVADSISKAGGTCAAVGLIIGACVFHFSTSCSGPFLNPSCSYVLGPAPMKNGQADTAMILAQGSLWGAVAGGVVGAGVSWLAKQSTADGPSSQP